MALKTGSLKWRESRFKGEVLKVHKSCCRLLLPRVLSQEFANLGGTAFITGSPKRLAIRGFRPRLCPGEGKERREKRRAHSEEGQGRRQGRRRKEKEGRKKEEEQSSFFSSSALHTTASMKC